MENETRSIFDIEKSAVLGTIIDTKSKVELQKVAANNLVQLCYTSALFIYDKYSDHNSRKISLDGFNFDFHADDNDNITHINCQFMKNEFKIKVDKTSDNTNYEIFTRDDALFGYRYEIATKTGTNVSDLTDDDIPMGWKSFTTNCIMCVVEEPYPYVQMNGIVKRANGSNFKDVHDTIIGYNLIRNQYISTYAKGVESDICNKQIRLIKAIGENISLFKALSKKTANDIKARSSFINILAQSKNDLDKKIASNKRVIRHGKKSINKLKNKINKYN